MTIKEFTTQYFQVLTRVLPAEQFSIVDDSTIAAGSAGQAFSVSVDNAFREYLAAPDQLQEILDRYVRVTGEYFQPRGRIQADRIVPVIKPASYLDDIRMQAGDSAAGETLYEWYNDQLVIAYAEDTEHSIRYLNRNDLQALSIPRDDLRSTAADNLAQLLPDIQRQGGDGIFMLTAGGNYEASIILLQAIFTPENFPVEGDFVIAIPNRDMLLLTGSHDQDGIASIKDIAGRSFASGNHPLSACLYRWNGSIFERFDD